MIQLKPFIIDSTGWLEAAWVNVEQQPDKGEIESPVYCQSFHPTQINLLRDKAGEYGTPLTEYEQMLADWVNSYVPEPRVTPPEISRFEKDQIRYQKRAAVKDDLIAYMAADNMSRVRDGAWSVADLTSLLDDPAVVAANALMGTLSFELAAQQIQAATTTLLTPEIKVDWVSRLEAHYYLEG